MDCPDQPPRLAFGHLDPDLEEEGLMFDVVLGVVPGERLCSVKLAELEPVQRPETKKTKTAGSVPECQMKDAGAHLRCEAP
jgi:hypothetical protein